MLRGIVFRQKPNGQCGGRRNYAICTCFSQALLTVIPAPNEWSEIPLQILLTVLKLPESFDRDCHVHLMPLELSLQILVVNNEALIC